MDQKRTDGICPCDVGVGVSVREYFREPDSSTAPVPQRLIIETSGGEAVTAADGTITVKVETPEKELTNQPVAPEAIVTESAKPKVAAPAVAEEVAASTVPEKKTEEAVVVLDDKSEMADKKAIAEASSNTAGGLGEAAVREKTNSEELVPEQARALAESVGQKISPILQSLRK